MLVTEFLGMYINDFSRELLVQATDIEAYLSALIGQLKAAASKLESGLFSECCRESELIDPLRRADRKSSCTYNTDT